MKERLEGECRSTQCEGRCAAALRRLAPLVALLLVALMGNGVGVAGAATLAARTGAVLTPRNFPNHTPDDVAAMFRVDAELGSVAVLRMDWNDANRAQAMPALVSLAQGSNLMPVVELNPLKADEIAGARIDPPPDAAAGRRASFADPAFAEAYSAAVLEFARLKPPYLAVATDVNLLALSDPGEYRAFANVYARLYPRIKAIAPDTRVFVTFQWEALQRAERGAGRALVDAFRPQLDVLAIHSEPRRLYERQGPAGVPADYYARLMGYVAGREPLFVEVGWPSDGGSGEADQAAFVRRLPALLQPLAPEVVAWSFLHDVRVLLFTLRAGLLTADGTRKPAFAAWREVSADRAAAPPPGPAALSRAPRGKLAVASREPARFGVYTVRLDGTDFRTLITSPDQEMTHPRVSPDGTRIVFTRYHARGKDGLATEEGGYENTEVAIMNLDGTGLETIVPPKPGVIAANGCWTPDGKGLIWLSTDNPERSPEILRIDLATREVTRVPTPAGLKTTDPHWEAGRIVFPAKAGRAGADALWLMNADGSEARQITRPKRTGILPGLYGDFDPKLSPDGRRVAFMRIDGGESWRVMVLDVASGEERDLTPKGVIEWLPTWSSDGRRLLYIHVDRSRMRETGLYTMAPDGSDRRKVPLPSGRFYNHSSFFPGDGSSERARIIFNGAEKPGL